MTQLGRFNSQHVYTLLGSHMLAVLNTITPIRNLRFARRDMISRNDVVETGEIMFADAGSPAANVSGTLCGSIHLSLNSPVKRRDVVLYGSTGSVLCDLSSPGAVRLSRYEARRRDADQLREPPSHDYGAAPHPPGLRNAVSVFHDVLCGRQEGNLNAAVQVQEILDTLLAK
jgi:hypothetical protein